MQKHLGRGGKLHVDIVAGHGGETIRSVRLCAPSCPDFKGDDHRRVSGAIYESSSLRLSA